MSAHEKNPDCRFGRGGDSVFELPAEGEFLKPTPASSPPKPSPSTANSTPPARKAIAWLNLGDAWSKAGAAEKAKKAYQTYLELAPNGAGAGYVKEALGRL